MNKKHKTFNEKEIEILNEISDKTTIYDETQCGPQEEPFITEIKIDPEKYNKKDNRN